LATGGFLHPKQVVFEGQDQFTSRIVHSQDVSDMAEFKDQKVIILTPALTMRNKKSELHKILLYIGIIITIQMYEEDAALILAC